MLVLPADGSDGHRVLLQRVSLSELGNLGSSNEMADAECIVSAGEMVMIILFPLLVALAGALFYGLSNNGKIQELGRLAFACGLLALVLRADSLRIAFFQ